jgi:hypothetical protein
LVDESTGERIIRQSLDELKIDYEEQRIIHGLRGDTKSYRIADFYLPKENIYIEFFGGWDKNDDIEREDERRRYRHKRIVYEKNNIKCIFIYPKQLYYIDYAIKKGIKKIKETPSKTLSKNGIPLSEELIVIIVGLIFIISIFTSNILLGGVVIAIGVYLLLKKKGDKIRRKIRKKSKRSAIKKT